LNNTGVGWEVRLRLPGNHTLTPTEERQLREFAITYSNLYDDVIANKGVAGTACEEEPGEEGKQQEKEAYSSHHSRYHHQRRRGLARRVRSMGEAATGGTT
jgi:hypothetical protein